MLTFPLYECCVDTPVPVAFEVLKFTCKVSEGKGRAVVPTCGSAAGSSGSRGRAGAAPGTVRGAVIAPAS